MTRTETFWQNKIYNWRHSEWEWTPSAGDAVEFEPYQSHRGVFCECVAVCGYYAIIDVPKGGHPWFDGPEGYYLVPERLLFPQ